jgi:hypothetical protein
MGTTPARTSAALAVALGAALVLAAPAHAVKKGEVYAKLFVSQYRATEFFDSTGDRVPYEFGGESVFRTGLFSTQYGISDRFNPGLQVRLVYSSFENEFARRWRTELTDVVLSGEYYFSSFPVLSSVRGGWEIPLGYDEDEEPWVGTGSHAVFAEARHKRFLEALDLDVEIRAGIFTYLQQTSRVDDGTTIVPTDLFLNYYPRSTDWAVSGGARFQWQEGSWYVKGDLGLKVQVVEKVIVEVLGSYWLLGESTGAGFSVGGGISYGYLDFPF